MTHAQHVAAVAVLVLRDERVLALRRSAHKDAAPGVWEALSGRLEPDEDPWEAAVREAHEETGLDIAVERRPWTAYAADRAGEPMLVVVYRGVPVGGELRLSDEHDDAAWLDAGEFAERSPLTALVDAVRSALSAPAPAPANAHDLADVPDVRADLRLSRQEMRTMGYQVIDSLADDLGTLAHRAASVSSPSRLEMEQRLREDAPEHGRPFGEVLARIQNDVLAEGLRVDHPRFFAYVPGPSNYVSVLADLIATGRNVFAGSWQAAPGAVEVELVTVDWFRRELGMPLETGGSFVSGGSMANLTALATARHARSAGPDSVIYLSDQTHASVAKGLRILGFTDDAIRTLPSDAAYRLDPESLRSAIEEDRARGLTPFCIVANAGTTNTGAVDPLSEIANVASEEGPWLHVDGAYGAAAAVAEPGRRALAGIERADSVSLDPHKWFFQPFETGLVLVRDRTLLRDTFAVSASYLRDAERMARTKLPEPNPFDHGLQLTRSFRALKVWTSVQVFGMEAFRRAVTHGFELAEAAQATLLARPEWEVVTPASMAIVTFRYVGSGVKDAAEADDLQRTLAKRLADDGFAMVSTTQLRGRTVLRLCSIHPATTVDDVVATLDRLEALAQQD